MPNPNESHIVRSYRELDAWQLAMDTVVATYRVSRAFPADERFGLTAQVRRAAVSIAANMPKVAIDSDHVSSAMAFPLRAVQWPK